MKTSQTDAFTSSLEQKPSLLKNGFLLPFLRFPVLCPTSQYNFLKQATQLRFLKIYRNSDTPIFFPPSRSEKSSAISDPHLTSPVPVPEAHNANERRVGIQSADQPLAAGHPRPGRRSAVPPDRPHPLRYDSATV